MRWRQSACASSIAFLSSFASFWGPRISASASLQFHSAALLQAGLGFADRLGDESSQGSRAKRQEKRQKRQKRLASCMAHIPGKKWKKTHGAPLSPLGPLGEGKEGRKGKELLRMPAQNDTASCAKAVPCRLEKVQVRKIGVAGGVETSATRRGRAKELVGGMARDKRRKE